MEMPNHENYNRIHRAAKAGKPTASRALRTINEGSGFMLKNARKYGTAMEKELIEEALAEAAIGSNPWLKIELQ